jgi:hypothetical protein
MMRRLSKTQYPKNEALVKMPKYCEIKTSFPKLLTEQKFDFISSAWWIFNQIEDLLDFKEPLKQSEQFSTVSHLH